MLAPLTSTSCKLNTIDLEPFVSYIKHMVDRVTLYSPLLYYRVPIGSEILNQGLDTIATDPPAFQAYCIECGVIYKTER